MPPATEPRKRERRPLRRTSGSCIRPANKRVHAGEPGDGLGVHHLLQVGQRPRARDEDVASAGDEEQHQVRGEREDVVQRQRGQHHLLADAQPGPPRLQALLDVGEQVAVREHRALGHAGGAAGVLQRGERVVRQRRRVDAADRRRRRCARALAQGARERHVARRRSAGSSSYVLLHRPHERALERRQQIGDRHDDDGANRRLRQHLRDLRRRTDRW